MNEFKIYTNNTTVNVYIEEIGNKLIGIEIPKNQFNKINEKSVNEYLRYDMESIMAEQIFKINKPEKIASEYVGEVDLDIRDDIIEYVDDKVSELSELEIKLWCLY